MVVELKERKGRCRPYCRDACRQITAKCGTYDKKVWDVCNPMFKVANNVPLL